MKRLIISLLFSTVMVSTAHAADEESAKELYDNHCTKCHNSDVMTRNDRRVQNFQQLHAQVRRCELNLGLQWFEDDIDSMAKYLNTHFYRFKTDE